jgi:O-antigen ligase
MAPTAPGWFMDCYLESSMNTNELGRVWSEPLARPKPMPRAARWPYQVAIFTSLFGLFSIGADQTTGGGSVLREMLWLLLAVCSLPGIFSFSLQRHWHGVRNASMLALGLLLMYCLFSSSWSAIHFVSFKRALLLLMVASICYAAFGREDVDGGDFLKMTAAPIFLLLILSYLAALLIPSVAITPLGWAGITGFKNTFGALCAISLLCSLCLIGTLSLLYLLPLTLLSCAGLVLSQSVTCMVALLFAMGLGGLILLGSQAQRRVWLRPWILGLGMLSLFAAYLVFALGLIPPLDTLQDYLFSVLGRSRTLTGRTHLWTLVLDNSRYHNHWIGGGYGGFWNGLDSPAGYTAWDFTGGYVGEAHNGYIDIYNELGYIGLFWLLVFYLVYLRNILSPALRGHREFYFHICFAIFILAHNFAESALFRTTDILNVIMLASFIRVTTLIERAKTRS